MVTGRARRFAIAGLSLALHAAILVWLAWPRAPELFVNGADRSSMTVELARPARPEPLSLPRTSAHAPARAGPLAPVSPPREVSPPVAAAPSGASAPETAALPDQARLRAALRAGVGCVRAAPRSREEREACQERLGAVSADGPSYAAPMDPEKRAYYDELAAASASSRSRDGANPGALQILKCSVTFGAGAKEKDRQGTVRLGKTPCYIPFQGSFFTPEAGVHKR